MTIEQLRMACGAKPHRPFALHLTGGREISVAQRAFMVQASSDRTMLVYQPVGSRKIVHPRLATSLEFGETPGNTKRGKN